MFGSDRRRKWHYNAARGRAAFRTVSRLGDTRVIYRFEHFEVDVTEFRLSEHGKSLQIEPKALRVLLCLLENRNRLVRKQELLDTVWKDAFVTESTLTRTISLLRKALADDKHEPRLIETVPTLGYRFKGIVEVVSPTTAGPIESLPFHLPLGKPRELDDEGRGSMGAIQERRYLSLVSALTPVEIPQPEELIAASMVAEVATPHATEQVEAAVPRSHKWLLLTAFLVIAMTAASMVLWLRYRKVLTEKDTVVLADFANSTGDQVFDETLRQGMAIQLEQSPFLSLISDERTQDELRLMGQPPDARLTLQLAQEVCVRTGSSAVLNGSVAKVGSQYVLGLVAKDCHTGSVLSEQQIQVAKKEDVLTALSQIAGKFRTSVGESLATVEKHNTPLDEATTTSLAALKAYSAGSKVARTEGEGAAIPFFKRAVEIDPGFAIAYSALAVMYGSVGESDLGAANAKKAYELRDRANDNERFFITAYYDGRATGNQERARQTCETWIRAYPRQVGPYGFLSGFIYPVLGEYRKGAEAAEKNIELSPDTSIAYVSRGFNLVALDRLDEAQNTLQEASARGLDVPFALLLWHDLAFLRADKPARERVVAKAQGNSDAEDWMADHEAAALAFAGQLQQASAMSQHAVGLAQQAGHTERAALFETRVALREALFGNPQAATESARQALEFTHDREVEYGTAFALALSGDSSRAEALVTDLEKRFPEDTSVRYNYVPVLRGRLTLNHGDAAKAIEQLKIADSYEIGTPRSAINAFFGAMYPVYVRGEAYLGAHQGAAAAAEFQKILSHRGVVIGDPIGALAHLQLGRAYALVGDNDRARAAYRDFLALWKDADPDIPIFKQAKAEYTKLN